MSAKTDREHMRRALVLALSAGRRTHPNPRVGCVIVRGRKILAEGRTQRPGEAHAEIDALAKIGGRARGATAYVTLEPCNHQGRTGPCTEALLSAGVARVVVALRDPNSRVRGGGVEKLERAGVTVEVGLCEAESRAVNRDWLHWVATGRPLVTIKAATTLDGRIAARTGDARWVSGEESRQLTRTLRCLYDAILVGARTVERDDPKLTTRERGLPDPRRVIVDGRLSTPPGAQAVPSSLIFTTRRAPERRAAKLRARGAEVVRLPGETRVDLARVLDELGRRDIQSLLVEGGGEIHGQLVERGLADQLLLVIAPKLIGAGGVPLIAAKGPARMAEAWPVEDISIQRRGGDILLFGTLARPARRR